MQTVQRSRTPLVVESSAACLTTGWAAPALAAWGRGTGSCDETRKLPRRRTNATFASAIWWNSGVLVVHGQRPWLLCWRTSGAHRVFSAPSAQTSVAHVCSELWSESLPRFPEPARTRRTPVTLTSRWHPSAHARCAHASAAHKAGSPLLVSHTAHALTGAVPPPSGARRCACPSQESRWCRSCERGSGRAIRCVATAPSRQAHPCQKPSSTAGAVA